MSYTIPIFYACDDGFVKYMMVSMKSLITNASMLHRYHIYILHTHISQENKEKILRLADFRFEITFEDVSDRLAVIEKDLFVRDYYSKTTYYRLFLSEMFPRLDKAIYIDADTIVTGDISKMYKYELGNHFIGAVRDQVIAQTETFQEYVENVLGVEESSYFNAGVVLINCKAFRKNHVLKKFVELLNTYTFGVAQDQDYLNIICKNKVLWMDNKWNVQAFGRIACNEKDICLVHYNLNNKPWHYKDCNLAEYFWQYAKETEDYEEILEILENYSETEKEKDKMSSIRLVQMAEDEIRREDNYVKLYGDNEEQSLSRRVVLNKIAQYEEEGWFDRDVEEDPPSRELKPEEIDYLHKSAREKFRTAYAFRFARWFMNTMIRKKKLIIKDIVGIENYRGLKSGAIITCNHFNALDSFAMQIAYEASGQKKRKFYRIIKEGNYTSFPGFYGLLMRNCNTLPLSSNHATMKKFFSAVDTLLKKGNFVLIYPEQSLWWNYRKPKPLKKGGFAIASKNHVPVLPCFITMEDTKYKDDDGFPVQAYTIHIEKPIYPDKSKDRHDNAKSMMMENYEVWKKIYEETYGIPLTYTTKKKTIKGEK